MKLSLNHLKLSSGTDDDLINIINHLQAMTDLFVRGVFLLSATKSET